MTQNLPKGGEFLLSDTNLDSFFIPEEFTEEDKMYAKTAEDFISNEVLPKFDDLEAQTDGLMPSLIKKAGELGLLMVDIPEKYNGLGISKKSSMLITEKMAAGGAFASAFGAHSGIGSLPIVFFGNENQKQKYLPILGQGTKLGAYALTEANAGTDALSGKAKAVLSEDGKNYILNGEKVFITNAGFADLFIVFAKIDGEKFTAFIVERDFTGISTGAEEKKMGIKGSSTRALILEDVHVPTENVLGEIGKGHHIAFNILNIGRLKLGVGCIGGAKLTLSGAIRYAKERKQFGKSISEFGLIREKIADMAIKTFTAESMAYRTAGLLDNKLDSVNKDDSSEVMKGIEEYAVECSILKVYGSEILDFIVDEALQIHGGYGYCQEYPMERYYRDARINRIYEGTNEINRMLINGTLLKRAAKGQLPIFSASKKLMDELLTLPSDDASDGFLASENKIVSNWKKIYLAVAGSAALKFMDKISEKQEILAAGSDIVIEIFAGESAICRAQKLYSKGERDKATFLASMVTTYINDTMPKIDFLAKKALAAIHEGDTLRTILTALRRLTKYTPVNTIDIKNKIAVRFIEEEKYFI